MSRLFGFALGVAVTLGGVYWLLRPLDPPGEPASSPTTVNASSRPVPKSFAGPEPDSTLSEWSLSEGNGDATAAGQVVSVVGQTLAQATVTTQAWAEPPVGADPEPSDAAARQVPALPKPELPTPLAGAGSADPEPLPPVEVAPVVQSQDEASPWQESGTHVMEDAAPQDNLRFVFWSPFRSERAARGFADRLSLATAIQVEVLRLEAGRYRVAFDYRDEAERLAFLERIEKITGLDVSEDGPR